MFFLQSESRSAKLMNDIIIPLYVALVFRKFRKILVLRGKLVQGQDKSDCGRRSPTR